MEESIKNFPKQFEWEPTIVNLKHEARNPKRVVVCGMGGSALAGDLLRSILWKTDASSSVSAPELIIWRDYALPSIALANEGVGDTLIIASSYSGNTEETISAFLEARKRGLPTAVIAASGKLLALAKKRGAPYIHIPNTGIQPRMATGFIIKALLKLIGGEEKLKEISKLSKLLDTRNAAVKGEELARFLRGKTPIIYASNKNLPIAYTWKIKLNETGKIPAFANRFPELNHNEMTGFDNLSRLNLNRLFSFIFLEDREDNSKISKKMDVTKKMYEDRKLEVRSLRLEGQNKFYRIFQNLLVADWTAFYLAKYYGVDPEQVPMVEEFKNLIK